MHITLLFRLFLSVLTYALYLVFLYVVLEFSERNENPFWRFLVFLGSFAVLYATTYVIFIFAFSSAEVIVVDNQGHYSTSDWKYRFHRNGASFPVQEGNQYVYNPMGDTRDLVLTPVYYHRDSAGFAVPHPDVPDTLRGLFVALPHKASFIFRSPDQVYPTYVLNRKETLYHLGFAGDIPAYDRYLKLEFEVPDYSTSNIALLDNAVIEKPHPVFSAEPIPAEIEGKMRGVSYPEGAEIELDELRYLKLSYVDFEGKEQVGEMVCNKAIAGDLLEIFQALYEARYPIRSIRLIDDFGGKDEASMKADNTSCFNYRKKTGMRELSKHALGLAVDVNPFENPYVRPAKVKPAGAEDYADRTKAFPHKIDKDDLCYRLFRAHGFSWGGSWRSVKDYQHFEK